jgi:hydrogenase maturation protease
MLCIIGCGNSNRSDDGVGVFVAQNLKRHLQRHPHPDVRVFDAGTGGLDVMFQARGADQLIIVDASRSGSRPGAIFKVPGSELEGDADMRVGLHEFRWQHALAAGRKIFGAAFPADVSVFLVEAHSLDFGLELSAPVREAAVRVAIEIQDLIHLRANREETCDG